MALLCGVGWPEVKAVELMKQVNLINSDVLEGIRLTKEKVINSWN